MRNNYTKPCPQQMAQVFGGWLELPGAAPFTAFVKGAAFSPARNTPLARKRRIGIGQREM
jgi:hypothetical protein